MFRFICLFCLLKLPVCWAGSQMATESVYDPEQILQLAKGVERYAAQKGARVFVIARVGREPEKLPRDITFTHTAIAVYSEISLYSGEREMGYAIHNLYQTPNDPGRSVLVTDYPVDFFWSAKALKAGIIIPTSAVQKGLLQLISSQQATTLHNPKYSAIANPFNNQYQNCTEYTLDLINAAVYETTDLARLKRNTTAYFDAQPLHKSRFQIKLGAVVMPDITARDHKGKIKTATFTAIAHYMEKYNLMREAVMIDSSLTTTQLL